ncbi:MAG: hypothetical protein ACI9X0_000931, partial [Kiritimatiellia bacterium]
MKYNPSSLYAQRWLSAATVGLFILAAGAGLFAPNVHASDRPDVLPSNRRPNVIVIL